MSNAALKPRPDRHDIVVDEVFPHAPEAIWKALTTAELIGRWLMKPTGFEAVKVNVAPLSSMPFSVSDPSIPSTSTFSTFQVPRMASLSSLALSAFLSFSFALAGSAARVW